MGRIGYWWKNERLGSDAWLNVSNHNRSVIKIEYSPRGIALTPYIVSISKNGKIVEIKYFKTQKDSKNYVMSYMRSHSNG